LVVEESRKKSSAYVRRATIYDKPIFCNNAAVDKMGCCDDIGTEEETSGSVIYIYM